MDSNGGSNSNGGGGGNDTSDFVVAAVALVVSVVALLIAIMQALQQYFASAQGYSQCNTNVMGEWAASRKRTFQWDELRFEVHFDSPVIFVSPPKNENGPIEGKEIIFLDGSAKSSRDSLTPMDDFNPRKEYYKKTEKEKIHTADNERASWYVLLCILQQMERKSKQWQDGDYKPPPPNATSNELGLPELPPDLHEHHTLTVALQRKRRSWDTMPPSVTKPYATTTICHLIEMMGALGVYWKEFDRKRDRYWAEGNGLLVLGDRVSDLGIMFSIQVSGQCNFEANRVIPVDEIKELCFGHVPTIYRTKDDQRRLTISSDHSTDLGSLLMSNKAEIAETLTVIGCNQKTVRYFGDESARVSHLFPVSFEVIGMLSQTFHIEHSGFTFIPNPTPDVLDKRALSFSKMLCSFKRKLQLDENRDGVVLGKLIQHVQEIQKEDPEGGAIDKYKTLARLHAALRDADEILTGISKPERQRLLFLQQEQRKEQQKQKQQKQQKQQQQPNGVAHKKSPEEQELDALSRRLERRRSTVLNVLSLHIQEVMFRLNQDLRINDAQSVRNLTVGGPAQGPPSIHATEDLRSSATPFEGMNVAGPGQRQDEFVEVYFEVIRPAVKTLAEHFAATVPVPTAPASPDSTATAADTTASTSQEGSVGKALLASYEPSCDDIWCTLVFRMICWLMLHNFDRNDVQLTKSELLGSRMPVYIS